MLIWQDAGRDNADVVITKRDDGALEITATYKMGRRDYKVLVGVASAVTLGALICKASGAETDGWVLAVAIAIVGAALWIAKDYVEAEKVSTLLVTDGALTNLAADVKVLRREVRELKHYSGSEDQAAGLYADRSFWKKTLLLEHVSKRQSEVIIDVVHNHYPRGWKDDSSTGNNFGLI